MERKLDFGMELPEIIKFACSAAETLHELHADHDQVSEVNWSEHEQTILHCRTIITPQDSCMDIVGCNHIVLDIAKSFVRKIEAVKTSQEAEKLLKSIGINGFLLIGLPGVGKTSLLKMVAVRIARLLKTNISFFEVSCQDLQDKHVGESQKLISALFRVADKSSPSLLCVDEIDGFCAKRQDDEQQHVRSFKTTFMAAMNGITPHPCTITGAATNLPWNLDSALLRRFEMKYLIRPPALAARLQIMANTIHTDTGIPVDQHPGLDLNDDNIKRLTDGFTGSDVVTAVKKAVQRSTMLVHNGELVTDSEFAELQEEMEQNKEPCGHHIGHLTNNVLINCGIKYVTPSYDIDDIEKLDTFADEHNANADVFDPINNEHQDQADGKACSFDLFSLFCCCSSC